VDYEVSWFGRRQDVEKRPSTAVRYASARKSTPHADPDRVCRGFLILLHALYLNIFEHPVQKVFFNNLLTAYLDEI